MKVATMKASLRYDGCVCVEVVDGNTIYSLVWNYYNNSKSVSKSKERVKSVAYDEGKTEEMKASDE